MIGELVHNLRLVRCPKCKLLLPENPEYDVYECGECGTKLQAKKRKSVAVNSEYSTQETDAAPRNALILVSGDEQCGNRKQLAASHGDGSSKVEETSSSSSECYVDGSVGRGRNENGECIGDDELQPFNLCNEEQEIELDIYKLSLRRRHKVSNKGCSNQATHCEAEEINSGNMSSEGSKEAFICALGENGNNEKPALAKAMSEMESTRSDSELAEELYVGNLSLEGAEEELTSGGEEEYSNDNKSALVVASPEVEINGNELEKTEEFSSANLLQERAEGELVSGSVKEDENKNKLSSEDVNPEMEIPRSDSEGAEELDNENLLVKEAEEKSISGSVGEDANEDKSASAGASPEVEIAKSDLERVEESNNGSLLLKGSEEKLMSALDGEYANNDELAIGENLEVEITGSNIAGEELKICAPDGGDPKTDQSAQVGEKSEVGIAECSSTTKTSSVENFVREKESILCVTPDKVEQGASSNPTSSNKLQKHAQKSIHHSFEHVRSVDTLDTTEYVNPSSELSGNLGGFSKSPTTRTRSSYAYDGSLSSYDGMDEQFSIQHLDSFENTRTISNSVSEEMIRKGKGLANSRVYGHLGTQQQSYFPPGKHHVMKDNRGNQNKVLGTTRHGDQHWTRTRRDEIPLRMPFRRSGSQSHYESSRLTNQIHDEPYYSSSFPSHDLSEQSYQENMKLLKMILKLQDQLNRTHYASRETNGRQSIGFSNKGKHISSNHSPDLHERRFSHGLDYPRFNGRCSHEVNWHRRNNFSRIPYSDQATSSAKHVDHSCSHCHQKKWHFSADFSPCSLFHHEELCRSCRGHDCFLSHHSYPSSPQWLTTSKLQVHGHETQPDDQKHRAHELRRYLREKQHLAKQNYRPVAGGAPFVTCHKCLNLLRLPADFLLSKSGPHQLKCGHCSEVLKFSLQNGSLVSYSSNALGRPSSGLNDQNKVI